MTTLGSFILIKNEAQWIGPHLAAWLPVLDQMVFADGGSTDGTLEIIKAFQEGPHGHKIFLYHDDPKDLEGDYVRAFDECMRRLTTDLAFFLHPDMLPSGPVNPVWRSWGPDVVAGCVRVRSFAGEPDGPLLEIVEGRGAAWKNIHRLNNPDLGAHYHGHYGAYNEDVYFSAITGDKHEMQPRMADYPFDVKDSGLELLHFSDVRSPRRRYERMVKCMMNQGRSEDRSRELAAVHPRVTLKDGEDNVGKPFRFIPAQYPDVFTTWKDSLKVPA